jgi:radical SAM protein with 4Fe4S-binding SPASM domain
MLSLSNLFCDHRGGNEALRYGHRAKVGAGTGVGELPVREVHRTPKPVTVWAVTKACNLRCVHCYASATTAPAVDELSFAEGMDLLEDLAEFGVPAILFSGGEPLARADTLQLIQHARALGMSCTLSTNGLLIDESTADLLARVGLKYVGISIDGCRDRHDRLRGQKGAFDGAVAAIRRLRARGIRVGVRFTVHAKNLADLEAVIELCQVEKVDRLCIYHLAYAGRATNLTRIDLSHEQTRAMMDRLIERTREMHTEMDKGGVKLEVLTVANHADAAYVQLYARRNMPELAGGIAELLERTGGNRSGQNIASIDASGNVHYDQFSWHYSCGNVREKRFSRIWTEAADPRLAVLRDRAGKLPGRCQGCKYLGVCNGNLRTRAETATGDWMGVDPGCYLTEAEIAG